MRLIITNNKKVESYFKGKEEVIRVNSDYEVFDEGMKTISKGGRLLHDPSKGFGYYRSLVFTMAGDSIPADSSVEVLKACFGKVANHQEKSGEIKEPIFSGILQNRDLNLIKSL
jgi:hypothetical protein